MVKFAVFCVNIYIEKGARWKGHFIGRPTKQEVLDAINEDWLDQRSTLKPDDDLGRRMSKSKFGHISQLVVDNGLPKGSTLPCTYAGLTVGSIRVERIAYAIATLDNASQIGSCEVKV
jgi:hypothetical protein